MPKRKIKHLTKKNFFLKKNKLMKTIVNVPLDPKTGRPLFHKEKVEESKILKKGQHIQYRALLKKTGGKEEQYYVRLVII